MLQRIDVELRLGIQLSLKGLVFSLIPTVKSFFGYLDYHEIDQYHCRQNAIKLCGRRNEPEIGAQWDIWYDSSNCYHD